MPISIRFATFPRTDPPPEFTEPVVHVFRHCEAEISTLAHTKGLTSNEVLALVRPGLVGLGFKVESGKTKAAKIDRPVFFGDDGVPTVKYQIDAYHDGWRCGLEVEAGRAWMGNAVYRDLIQAMVMVQVDHLVLAVPNLYRYQTAGKAATSRDFENTRAVADAVYGHSRVEMPYRLLLIGY